MTSTWTGKQLALTAGVVSLVCVAALLVMIGLAYPDPIISGVLGPDWQCSRLAFVFTTCSRVPRAETVSARVRKDPDCLRSRRQ